MRYAGFGPRAMAGLVDYGVFLPLALLVSWLSSLSWEIALVVSIPYMCSYAAYNVWCHARWGQTVGKRVAGIRVVAGGRCRHRVAAGAAAARGRYRHRGGDGSSRSSRAPGRLA